MNKQNPHHQKILVNGLLGELRAQLGMAIENVGEVQRSRDREREFDRFRVIDSMYKKLNDSFIQTINEWLRLVLNQVPRSIGTRVLSSHIEMALEAINLYSKFEDIPHSERDQIKELREVISIRDRFLELSAPEEPSALYMTYSHLYTVSRDLNRDSFMIFLDDLTGIILHSDLTTPAQIDIVEEICRIFDVNT
jgi:aspartyl-tRNA synthetase